MLENMSVPDATLRSDTPTVHLHLLGKTKIFSPLVGHLRNIWSVFAFFFLLMKLLQAGQYLFLFEHLFHIIQGRHQEWKGWVLWKFCV